MKQAPILTSELMKKKKKKKNGFTVIHSSNLCRALEANT